MSSAQASSSLAADAPRYGNDPLVGAYYARNTGSGAPVVSQLLAGAGITLNPTGGQGVVTVTSTAQGLSSLNTQTGAVTLTSSNGTIDVTTTTGNVNLSVPGVTTTNFTLSPTFLPTSGPVTIQALTGLTIGQTYSLNMFLSWAVGGAGGTVNPSVSDATVTAQLYVLSAKFPGSNATGASSQAPITAVPLAPLATSIFGGTQGAAGVAFYTYTAQFTALATTCNLVFQVSSKSNPNGGPFITASSIGIVANSYINITPLLLTTI